MSGGLGFVHPVDRIAVLLQPDSSSTPEQRVVFNEKYAQVGILPAIWPGLLTDRAGMQLFARVLLLREDVRAKHSRVSDSYN